MSDDEDLSKATAKTRLKAILKDAKRHQMPGSKGVDAPRSMLDQRRAEIQQVNENERGTP